eukprot:m.330996 g.330996  ORF g.330996 m.330996 type:complete len:286 (-) comp16622_c0_seq1:2406-3263(-)
MMFEPLSSSKSVLLCDVPFLESACDLPFRAHNADVPEDLLLCTPIDGWDTPPDSPINIPMLDYAESTLEDPILTKVTKFLEDDEILPTLGMSDKLRLEPIFDWTPPPSPVSDTSCDDILHSIPYLDQCAPVPTRMAPPASQVRRGPTPVNTHYKPSNKRKATSSDDDARKRIREKSEAERAARTAACEQAVKALSGGKNDEDPESRRHTHNVLERKRRNDLKNSYQLLREHIPSLEENERAPTGQILVHAVEYINQLKQEESSIAAGLAQLRSQNEQLRRTLGLH